MNTYSLVREDNIKTCLIHLYPLVRESDGKHFFGVFHDEEKLWLVVDKLSFRVIETIKDDCGDIYDLKDETDVNKRPEEGFVYLTDTKQDYMKFSEPYLSLETIKDKILSTVENYDQETEKNDELKNDYIIVDGRKDTKAELYRYENYVMRYFKSRYFDKIVEISDGEREKKYFCVNDIIVDYEQCPISPVLKFTGETIKISHKVGHPSILMEYTNIEQSEWHNVGLLDEIMLKYGRRTVTFDNVKIVDDLSVIEKYLKESAEKTIQDMLSQCAFLK